MALSKMKFAYFVLVAVQAAFALPQQNPTSTAVSRPSSTSLPAGASAGAPSAPGSSAVPQPGATFPGPGAPLVPGAPQGAPAGAGPGASAGPSSGNATGAHGPPGAAGAAGAAAAAAAGAGGQPGGDPTPRPGAPRGLNFLGKPNPIFFYEPDYSIAVGAVAVFFISFCLHAVALFTFKSWYFMVLAQAPLIDVVAAVARVFAVTHPGEMTPYVINMMCWSIPVSLVGIGLIFTSTRFILWVTPLDRLNVGTLLVSPIHISAIWGMLFVFPDIAKGVTAQMGKPKEGKHPNSTDIFHRIEATAGSFQFVFFGLFTLWFIRFMTISKNFAVPIEISSRPWRRFGWIIVVGNLLLTWRALWNTVDFDSRYDPNAFVSKHEWTFWVLSVLPMLLIYTLFNYEHPGLYFPRELTGFQLNTKKWLQKRIENAQAASMPQNVSSPQDDKSVEVITYEVAPGSDGRNRHQAGGRV